MAASRQVCTANTLVKQHISTYQELLAGGIKTYTARRMTRSQQHFQLIIAKAYCFSVFQEPDRFRRRFKGNIIHFTYFWRTVKYNFVLRMYFQANSIGLHNQSVTENMVNVAMCVQEPCNFQTLFFDIRE